MTKRVAGKGGRRPPKRHAAIELGTILTGVVPAHPASQDNLAKLSHWQMLGNDQAGDCVAVTYANFKRLITAVIGDHEVYPTQDEVWQIYRTQNPGFIPGTGPQGYGSPYDQGMDIQTLLEYLVKNKVIVAFARVDYTNLELVKAAESIFGGTWVGINVTAANEQEFSAGRPWDLVNSENLGGHSVLSGGYLGRSSSDVTFITWATETSFTDKFTTQGGVEEMWVVIWPEHLGTKAFQQGVDVKALAAAYQALTGKTLPIPAPTPTPTPNPSPSVDPDVALLDTWAAHNKTKSGAAAAAAWVRVKQTHNL